MKFKINFQVLTILAIVILAAFLRLYRISDYMTFLGDEGRDVLIAKGILEGHFTLLGPRASAGDFFTGPLYYYLMAPFLWLFHLDPVGPAVMIALIGIATVFLIYKVSKEFFGFKAAIVASALYAVSPLVIAYSRSSWNPNPMPFISLLTLYLSFKAIKTPTFKKFLGIGFLLGIALELHYIAVFLIIIVGTFLLSGYYIKNKAIEIPKILKQYFIVLLGFLIGMSPFLGFELRHGFPNTKTIFSFIFSTTLRTSYGDNISFIEIVKDVFFRLFGRLVTTFPPKEQLGFFDHNIIFLWQLATLILGLLSVFFIFSKKDKLTKLFFEIWILFGILLFGFYKKPIYDYYFGFMFPLPFMLIGSFLSQVYDSKKNYLKTSAVVIFVFLFALNLNSMPFKSEPNRQKDQVKQISKFVISKSDGKPFNFALITGGNSDHAYRYYFEVLGKPDVRMENIMNDPKRKTVTDQLLIVCESGNCHPLGYPSFEVSNFGRAEIVGSWDVSVVKVYKLIHYSGKEK